MVSQHGRLSHPPQPDGLPVQAQHAFFGTHALHRAELLT